MSFFFQIWLAQVSSNIKEAVLLWTTAKTNTANGQRPTMPYKQEDKSQTCLKYAT